MYAVQPKPHSPTPAPQPQDHPQRQHRRSSSQRQAQHRAQQEAHLAALASESVAKLAVNLLLLGTFSSALFRLVPYALNQHGKLNEIEANVAAAQTRVDILQTQFTYAFDPKRATDVMQEQSYLVDPYRKEIQFAQEPITPEALATETP